MKILISSLCLVVSLSVWAGEGKRNWQQFTSHDSVNARLIRPVRDAMPGWTVEGEAYQLRCDEQSDRCRVALFRNLAGRDAREGALMHRESATVWRGITVELRAEVRTGGAEAANLVILAKDREGHVVALARGTTLTGTNGFTNQTVKLEVPETAEELAYGFELHGTGALFLRSYDFEDTQFSPAARASR